MDRKKLEDRMKACGISKKQAYQRLKISRSAFYRKCNGLSEFDLSEVETLMEMLDLKPAKASEIFFGKEVS